MQWSFNTLTVPVIFTFILQSFAAAGVIFEDNFDNSPDWQSKQTISKSQPSGLDIAWPRTYYASCTSYNPSYCPPKNWTSYRAASSQWTDNPGKDTFILSKEGARGGRGKGITYNVESTGDYGTWAGGALDLWLGEQGYQDLYVRMYLKYSPEWIWSKKLLVPPDLNGTHGQQKLIRIFTFNEDISTSKISPQGFGSVGINWPVWYPDWYYNAAYNQVSFFSSTRMAPSYHSDGDTTHSNVRWPTDNEWHCYEFHVKMNSAPGIRDGIWEFFLDGNLLAARNDVMWKEVGANSKGWNMLMVLDNVTIATYPKTDRKEMALYMDDFVVSTSYIGPDYIITGEGFANTNNSLPPRQPVKFNLKD